MKGLENLSTEGESGGRGAREKGGEGVEQTTAIKGGKGHDQKCQEKTRTQTINYT